MIAIIAILAVVVVLTLNPAQLLAQSRDANRLSDLSTLNSAINLYIVDQAGGSGFSLGTSSVTYLSIPDMTATTTAGTNCSGLGGSIATGTTYFDCSASSTLRTLGPLGWIPISFQNISSGAPFSSLPVDPTNNTSSNLYYSYQTNGNTFRLQADPESQKYAAQAGANSTAFISGSNTQLNGGNWVLVPGNSTFGTNDFYVMKYDAGCSDGKGNVLNDTTGSSDTTNYHIYANNSIACTGTGRQIASLPGAYPIADISQTTSASYCASIGAHLITNNEWQTIAWNAEAQASNWNGGVVGTSYMYSGHNDNNPAMASVASADDTQGYFGTSAATNQKRTLSLSNGSVIWDMAGNVWQWTNDTITGTNQPNAGVGAFGWHEFTAVTSWGTMTQSTAGPSNNTWNSSKGMGELYSEGATDATIYGFVRGGYWITGGAAGVVALYLSSVPGTANYYIGFRCAR